VTDNRIRWKGHSQAISGTNYKIYSDKTTPNDFTGTPVTQAATSPYAPVNTTLAENILAGATSVPLVSATGFANGNYGKIGRETFLFGGLTGATFATSLGGQHNTIKQDHAAGTVVYKMHETYLDTGVTYGTRHVIRYRVTATIGGVELVAAEAVTVKPSLPDTNDKIVIWGIQDKAWGVPHAGAVVTLGIDNPFSFAQGLAETIDTATQQAVTDASGYWELTAHRDIARAGGGSFVLTIDNARYAIVSLPDQDNVCYLECI